jgi:hypothetical protein
MNFRLLLSLILITTFTFAGQLPANNEKCAFKQHLENQKTKDVTLAQRIISDEAMLQNSLINPSVFRITNQIYTIPVVVHVVYKTGSQNISDAQIQSQIDVLNQDFARLNADTTSTPSGFVSIASATNFQFCLAQQDPSGQPSNGIDRRQTTVSTFQPNDDMKDFSTGGLNAWDVNKYLNIWVCNIGGGILGFGELPASVHTNTYGVVLAYNAFGKMGAATYPYNLGRTCTHEISHCFRLYHIWGDDGGTCSGTDYVNDTPNQGDATFGCLTYPATDNCNSTANGINFTNYMDYSDDNCLNMFTKNQASRMFTAVNMYYPTLFTSQVCQSPVDVKDTPADFTFSIYPSPSSTGVFSLDMFFTSNIGASINVKVVDVLGKTILEKQILNPAGTLHPIDLSFATSGLYFVTVYNDDFKKTERITVAR